MTVGKSIKLFLIDGSPKGMITAEIMNWSGHVLTAPRSRLVDLCARPETSRAGLYVLLGDNPDDDGPMAYIGETENIANRLKQHAQPQDKGGKDFWDRAFVITSKDANLTKSHLRFAESRLITTALNAKRIPLWNTMGTQNTYGLLPEADQADMLYFIEQIKLILPVLGLDFLREIAAPQSSNHNLEKESFSKEESPEFELNTPSYGITAKACIIDNDFVVKKGSLAKGSWSNTQQKPGYFKLYQQLQENGILQADPLHSDLLLFTENYAFSSPSAAAAIINGRSTNGRTAWQIADQKISYGEWETQCHHHK